MLLELRARRQPPHLNSLPSLITANLRLSSVRLQFLIVSVHLSAGGRRLPLLPFPATLPLLSFSHVDMTIRARRHTFVKLFDQIHQTFPTRHVLCELLRINLVTELHMFWYCAPRFKTLNQTADRPAFHDPIIVVRDSDVGGVDDVGAQTVKALCRS